MVGDKRYELANHLGNVLVVINDKKIPEFNILDTPGSGLKAFNADVLTYSDYYPFGMIIDARHRSKTDYRYGFQGQEMDNEIKGEGNPLNYTFRMHDPRVGRFFAVDPLFKEYPFYSPYQFSGNSPIVGIDLEGLEIQISNSTFTMKENKGTPVLNAEADFKVKIKILNLTGLKLTGTQQITSYASTRASNVYSDKTGTGNFQVPFDNGKLLKRPINYKINAKMKNFSVSFTDVNSLKDIKNGDIVMVLVNKRLSSDDANAYVNHLGGEVMVVDIGSPDYKTRVSKGEVNFNIQQSVAFDIGRTIVHEIGHLLGLDDQYTLTSSGAVPKRGYEKNVMANSDETGLTPQQVGEIVSDMFFQISQNKYMENKGEKVNQDDTKQQLKEVMKNEKISTN